MVGARNKQVYFYNGFSTALQMSLKKFMGHNNDDPCEYMIEEPAKCDYSNDALTLKLPLEVRISAKGLKTCDPAAEIKPHP